MFSSLANLITRFQSLGVKRMFFKRLAENDNSKQQIYLGGSFEVLTYFRYGDVQAFPEGKNPNFKAPIQLLWVTSETVEQAPYSQLILYPQYPEVRLSGFLRGCKAAPSKYMQAIPASERNGSDGRVLIFGTADDKKTFAYLAPRDSVVAKEAIYLASESAQQILFFEIPLQTQGGKSSKDLLLEAIKEIHLRSFVDSIRLNKAGKIIPYTARNGGGYTLEALLGIKPNAIAAPDFHGWEVKAFSSSRITLMTPEPSGGFYGEQGVEAFVRKYGRQVAGKNQLYFTGNHLFEVPNKTTRLKLVIDGFDSNSKKIKDVNGSIRLLDANGVDTASWSLSHLLTHWNRKHASAAYIPFENNKGTPPKYRYSSPIYLGEHTDFSKYLTAMSEGNIIFDPGSKIENPDGPKKSVKARSQFRIHKKDLDCLYETFEEIHL